MNHKLLARFSAFILVVLLMTACSGNSSSPAPSAPTTPAIVVGFTPASVCLVPNIVGLDQSKAEAILIKVGLQPVKKYQEDPSVAKDGIISQTPVADTRLSPCTSDVTIVVSLGVPTETPFPPTLSPVPTHTLLPPTVPPAHPCPKWDLASDFQIWPDQENPNRDSCGNLNVWYFMGSPTLERNPNTYFLLSNFKPDHDGIVGELGWYGPDSSPVLAFNATGATQHNYGDWPVGKIMVHPGRSKLVIIGWRSPMNGYINIQGTVMDKDSGGGDGVNWYIDKGTQGLTMGAFDNGNGQDFGKGIGGDQLNHVAISIGEFIYLVIHPKGGYEFDSTFVQLTITK